MATTGEGSNLKLTLPLPKGFTVEAAEVVEGVTGAAALGMKENAEGVVGAAEETGAAGLVAPAVPKVNPVVLVGATNEVGLLKIGE